MWQSHRKMQNKEALVLQRIQSEALASTLAQINNDFHDCPCISLCQYVCPGHNSGGLGGDHVLCDGCTLLLQLHLLHLANYSK